MKFGKCMITQLQIYESFMKNITKYMPLKTY